jgi:hypothetical protein
MCFQSCFDPFWRDLFQLSGFHSSRGGRFCGRGSFRYGLKGSYFALVTLAFAEVFRILATGVGMMLPLKGISCFPSGLKTRLGILDGSMCCKVVTIDEFSSSHLNKKQLGIFFCSEYVKVRAV